MDLTPAQNTALKNHVQNNTNTVVIGGITTQIKDVPNTLDTNPEVVAWYNQQASPNFTLWRKLVTLAEIAGKINGSELGGLTTANHTRLQTIVTLINAAGGANPSLADQRAFWDDIFSGAGGATTRANLLTLWKRLASNIHKLFSTGTGSDGSPATTDSNISDTYVLTVAQLTLARA